MGKLKLRAANLLDIAQIEQIHGDSMARFSEVPPVEIELLNTTAPRPFGLGEVSQGPTMAAIGNAVAHALGARIRDLPLTRERIASALLKA